MRILFIYLLPLLFQIYSCSNETDSNNTTIESNITENNTNTTINSNSSLLNNTSVNSTYNQRKKAKQNRTLNFYSKAVNDFSNKKLSVEEDSVFDNLYTIANKEIRENEDVITIPKNNTISSFDNYFPYFKEFQTVLDKYVSKKRDNVPLNPETENFIRLLLNVNYLRYYKKADTNRFFKIYFKNLPTEWDFTPFWDEEEKHIAKRILPDESLLEIFKTNNTEVIKIVNRLKKVIRKKDRSLIQAFTKLNIYETINLINTRSFIFTLKAWKVINKLTNKINSEDIDNYGFVILPGVDAINHEDVNYKAKDVTKTNFHYQNGKIIIKSGRNFNKGEEFKINYDRFSGVFETMKRYGYISLDSIKKDNNAIFKNEQINLSNHSENQRLLCLHLGACRGSSQNETDFLTTRRVNSIHTAKLNIYRIFNLKKNITKDNIVSIADDIEMNRHSDRTEATVLSKLIQDDYKSLLKAMHFRTSIQDLIDIYNLSIKKVRVRDIFTAKIYAPFPHSESNLLQKRLRELVKLSLLYQHMQTINVKEAATNLEEKLDQIWFGVKKRIFSNVSNRTKGKK